MKAYKTRLDPNNIHIEYFDRCCNVAKVAFNWGLNHWETLYAMDEKTSWQRVKKHFNAIKTEMFPFVLDVPGVVTESAFINLGAAFQRYFRERKDGKIAKRIRDMKANGKWKAHEARLLKRGRSGYQLDPGYPQFKRRKDANSFQFAIPKVYSHHIQIPVARGCTLRIARSVRLFEADYIPTKGKYAHYYTISRRAGKWFVSVVTHTTSDPLALYTSVIGIDFGIKAMAMGSSGKVFENPRNFYVYKDRLARLQRRASKQWEMNHNNPTWERKNWHKTQAAIAKMHAKVANTRRHYQHEMSSYFVYDCKPEIIVIENLNVSGMLKNHKLALAISDVGFYELRRQVEYKSEQAGVKVLLADRWFPSTKTCSRCGWKHQDIQLSDRIFICEKCGLIIDRDLNSSYNLAALVGG